MTRRVVEGRPLQWKEPDLAALLAARFSRNADKPAFLVRDGPSFVPLTWGQVGGCVREMAAGLLAMGVERGDRIAILADTRPEWVLFDMAILMAGGVSVSIYPTLPGKEVQDLLVDSGAGVIALDADEQENKLLGHAAPVRVLRLDRGTPGEGPLGALPDLRASGRTLLAERPDSLRVRRGLLRPHHPATIIYTSGTTGIPKGAVLTHENWVATTKMMIDVFDIESYAEPRTTIAFLPLAHVLSRLVAFTFADVGGQIAFSTPRALAKDLLEVRPRSIVCVPRIWERLHERIHAAVAKEPAHRRALFADAERVARAYGAALADGGRPHAFLRARHAMYEALVYRKLRERMGFDALEGALSTAAAVRPDLLAFFQGIGIRVYELWGLTELSGPGTTNTPERFRPGSVGWACPGVRVMLDDEGEILVSGPNVFAGYHERPEENAAAFVKEDGARWFRTGDLGSFDADGALRIVDRKKELEVLDTGKKIAPVRVEERLKVASPYVADSCLVATGRKYAGALIQPDYDRLVAFAREQGIPFEEAGVVVRPDPTGAPMTYAVPPALLADARVQALFRAAVERANAEAADFERIRAFRLVPHAFTVDRDELTPTLKKKRRTILVNHQKTVEEMFA